MSFKEEKAVSNTTMSDKTSVKLTRNKKLDVIFHKETGLVFNKNRLVTGRIANGEVIPLDIDCIELCKTNGFPFDESLLPEPEGEDVGDDAEAEEEGEAEQVEDSQGEAEAEAEPEPEPELVEDSKAEVDELIEETGDNIDHTPLLEITADHVTRLTECFDTIQRQNNATVSQLHNDIVKLQKELEEQKVKNAELGSKLDKLRSFLS